MTSKEKNQSHGLPPPITKLTMEQDLKMRQLELSLNKDDLDLEAVKTIFLALQRQNFVLCNSLTNLVEKWPKVQTTTNEVLPMFGILLENKDSTST